MKNFYNIKLFLELIGKTRKNKFSLVVCLLFLQSILEALGIGLVIPLVNLLLNEEYFDKINLEFLSEFSKREIVFFFLLIVFIFFIIKGVILYLITRISFKFIYEIQTYIKNKVFEKYINLDYSIFSQKKTSELISNLSVNMTLFTQTFVTPLMLAITECLILLSVMSVLIYFHPKSFLILSFFLIFVILLYMATLKNYLQKLGSEKEKNEDLQIKVINNAVGSIKISKFYYFQNLLLRDFSKFNKISSSSHGKLVTSQQVPRILLEILGFMGISIVILFLLLIGENNVKIISTVALFTAAAFRIIPSINRLIFSLQGLTFSDSILNTLKKEIEQDSNNKNIKISKKEIFIKNNIKLKNICFSYPAVNNYVLNDLNFDLTLGQSIGVSGKSGIGKSTFLDVLTGLHIPNKGEIYIDEKKINTDKYEWFKNFTYVTQNNFMFDDTLLNNIVLNDKNYDISRIKRILQALSLEEFVEAHPDKEMMLVGEKGSKLSGGQLQRIGIARAIYSNPSIIIMDEPTSALDMETEKFILKNIKNVCKSTFLIVSHKEATLEHCDIVYKFDETGKLEKKI